MKPTGLLIAVALLAVLGGAVWWSNKKQAAASKSPTDTSTKMLSIPDDQFQEIREKKLTGEVLALSRSTGKWRLTEPQHLAADQDSVGSMVSNLSSLNADKVIEDNATDLKPYGLDMPTLDIVVTKKDGKTAELLVGDDTPTGSGAYAKVANDPRVFTLGSFVKTGLDKKPDDLRDKRLLTFDSDRLTRVELVTKGQLVEIGKNSSNEWQIVKPRPLRADASAVDTMIGKLKDARIDTTTSADAGKQFAASPKGALVSLTDVSGTQTLEIRRDSKKDYYGKSSTVEGVFKVPSDLADALNKTLDDIRNKKVFDFGFSDPNELEVKGVKYTKTGDKWMAGSKAMDNISVQSLIDKIRDLTAIQFVDKAVGDPAFNIAVTSNGGKRVEKVTVTFGAGRYFAQREGEPSIYELNPTFVKELLETASAVKEAAPATPAKKK
ncbi:MAG: DUF4340 domain-containing protein [Acidobacteriia bacterium]|nr:DUF4340 domain-containing protein [Terriglobia bacterium]